MIFDRFYDFFSIVWMVNLLTFFSLRDTLLNFKNPKFFYTYLPTPPLGQDMTQGQFLIGV